jgi:hypothetical protein
MIDSKTIGRHLSVYFCIGVVYATYSFGLDLVFHSFEYASKNEYFGSIGWYLLLYLVFFYISSPIALVYNAIVNILPKKNLVRISFGIFIGAVGAALFKVPSRYGGINEKLKVVLVMALVGLSVEIIRILVVGLGWARKY